MSWEEFSEWIEAAWALDAEDVLKQLPVPFHVLVGEAIDAVRFAQRYAEPELDGAGRVVRPGLDAAIGQGRFTRDTASELRELADALQVAQTEYRLSIEPSRAAPIERAQQVLGELRASLEWCVADEQLPAIEAQLMALAEAHEGAFSQDAVAAALHDYAELARRSVEVLSRLREFDGGWIEEARTLAERLREQSAGPASWEGTRAEQSALELRNRLATLLYQRLLHLRAAARFVFRHHPSFLTEIGSSYSRKKQAAYRRRVQERGESAAAASQSTPTSSVAAEPP